MLVGWGSGKEGPEIDKLWTVQIGFNLEIADLAL